MNLIMVVSRGMAALRAGEALADPALWKHRQAAINAVTVAITAGVALANLFGLHIPVNAEWIGDIAYGCVGIATIYLTYATSAKVGLLPAKESTNATIPAENGVSSAVAVSVESGQPQLGKAPDSPILAASPAISDAGHAPVVRDAGPVVITVGSGSLWSDAGPAVGRVRALPSVGQPANATDGDDTKPNYSGNGWGDK